MSTFGHEEEEEQDTGTDLLSDPKRKDVEHVYLMLQVFIYMPFGYFFVFPSLSPSAMLLDATVWVLCLILRTQKGGEGAQRLRHSNEP